jgi:(p)ppGpp synthase/HD superfamily hydrolase
MTVEQAKELCIKAHEGQWRKSNKILFRYNLHPELQDVDEGIPHILEDGTKAVFDNINEKWKISIPYSSHPIAVAEMMTTDDEKIVAYLHDVIEDTSATLDPWDGLWLKFDGVNYPLSLKIYGALRRLTKFKEDEKPYKRYIQDVAENRLATKVKIADMFHNMSDNPSEKQKRKYLEGIKYLLTKI